MQLGGRLLKLRPGAPVSTVDEGQLSRSEVQQSLHRRKRPGFARPLGLLQRLGSTAEAPVDRAPGELDQPSLLITATLIGDGGSIQAGPPPLRLAAIGGEVIFEQSGVPQSDQVLAALEMCEGGLEFGRRNLQARFEPRCFGANQADASLQSRFGDCGLRVVQERPFRLSDEVYRSASVSLPQVPGKLDEMIDRSGVLRIGPSRLQIRNILVARVKYHRMPRSLADHGRRYAATCLAMNPSLPRPLLSTGSVGGRTAEGSVLQE